MSAEPESTRFRVLHLFGKDRPGLVNDTARFISKQDCDIHECVAHSLGDQAIIFMLISGSQESLQRVEQGVGQQLTEEGCEVQVRPASLAIPDTMRTFLWRIRIDSLDAHALLSDLSAVLKDRSVNIESYRGETYFPPRAAGREAYRQTFIVRAPKTLSRMALSQELSEKLQASSHDFSMCEVEPL